MESFSPRFLLAIGTLVTPSPSEFLLVPGKEYGCLDLPGDSERESDASYSYTDLSTSKTHLSLSRLAPGWQYEFYLKQPLELNFLGNDRREIFLPGAEAPIQERVNFGAK